MSGHNEHPKESIHPPEEVATGIGRLLEEVSQLNDKQLPAAMARIFLGTTEQEITDELRTSYLYGPEAAAREASHLTGQDPDSMVERGLAILPHSNVLDQSGLMVSEQSGRVSVLIQDGMKLATALQTAPTDPADRERLVRGLDRLIADHIDDLCWETLFASPASIEKLFGELPKDLRQYFIDIDDLDSPERRDTPEVYAESPVPSNLAHSFQQLLGAAPALAAAHRNLGGNEDVAKGLEDVAQFVREGDGIAWVASTVFGITWTPNTGPTYDGTRDWANWHTVHDWLPMLKLIDQLNPASSFRKHLLQALGSRLQQGAEEDSKILTWSLAQYRDFITRHEDSTSLPDRLGLLLAKRRARVSLATLQFIGRRLGLAGEPETPQP